MSRNDSGLTVARAALIGLRATISDSAGVNAYTIYLLPDMRPLSHQAAKQLLVGLPKPLTAVAIRRGSSLYFGTWPSGGFERTEMLQLFYEEIADARAIAESPSTTAVDVLLRTAHDDCPLTFEECRQFLRDYFLPFATIHLTLAAAGDLDKARLILRIGPPTDSTMRA